MKKYERKRKLPIKFNVGKENSQYIHTQYTYKHKIYLIYIYFFTYQTETDFCLKIIKK